MRVVAVGAAERARVRPEDRAQHPAVRRLQDVGAVHFLRGAVIPAEHAHLRLRLAPLSLLAPSLGGEQVEGGEAPSVGRGLSAPQLLVWSEERDALLQVVDGDRRGARGRPAAAQRTVQVSVRVSALPHQAGATRGVVLQTQGGFQRLCYRVRVARRAVNLVFSDKSGQTEIIIPEIKRVVVRRAHVQEIHPVRAAGFNVHRSEETVWMLRL